MSQKIIIPTPFAHSTYGQNQGDTYRHILNIQAANPIMSEHFPSNLFHKHCTTLDPVTYSQLPDDMPELGTYLRSAADMQTNLAKKIKENFAVDNQYLIIGGDHTISIGTGLGLSQHLDMSKIGLIYVDAHADCNTPETSLSKCITGYPVAVNCGLGPELLTSPFQNNYLKNVIYIGLRDVDELEVHNLSKINAATFSILDIQEQGISNIVKKALSEIQDCSHIWLSIDIDSLDPVYLEEGETDVPVPGGLTPNDLLYITHKVEQSGKLLLTEITQINNLHKTTPITVLASRIGELALGLGKFRYDQK
jgi:arginase